MAAEHLTPEAALKALESAYLRNDLDAAVAVKDFEVEATEMIKHLMKQAVPDPKLVK